MHRLHLSQVVGEERRDDQLQEHTSARREQPQPSRHGQAAPRPLRCWLAARVLQGRGIGQGASRALDEKWTMALPPPVVQGGSLPRAPETLEEESEEAPRESGSRVTIGRRTEPQARQVGQVTAGGVTVQKLS
jgi:hypothetical protein